MVVHSGLRGHFTEMRWRLDQALARRSLLPPALQANLLLARGAIAADDGEPGGRWRCIRKRWESNASG